jgi:hypothetical protein
MADDREDLEGSLTGPIDLRDRPPSRLPLEDVLEQFEGLLEEFNFQPPPREIIVIREPAL